MSYDPSKYWSSRLEDAFTLQGVGHLAYSPEYNRWMYRRKGDVLDRELGELNPGVEAVDVGSGVGWVVERLRSHGFRVRGVDIADVAVEQLRTRFPDVEFARAEVGTEPLPWADGSADVVTAMDVLYHVTDDGLWRAALAEFARILRPGGRLIVTDAMGAEDVEPAQHVRLRSEASWAQCAREHGFRPLRNRPLYGLLSRDKQRTRVFNALPDGVRGAVEYAADSIAIRRPVLFCSVFVRDGAPG